MRIRNGNNSDPGWKKVGSRINIPDAQHCPLPDGLLLPVSAPGGDGAVLGRHAGEHEGGHRLPVEVAQCH
jgi:hypothetical protein